MSVKVRVVIDVDDELADPDDTTGLTAEAYDEMTEALMPFGTLAEGPEKVQ